MIEIFSVGHPLEVKGRVGDYDFTMVGLSDHWVFYIPDPLFPCCGESIMRLHAKYPGAAYMPKPLAIRIANACAKRWEKVFNEISQATD